MVVNQNPGGKQEAPVISVSSSGLITATAGDETTTRQLPTQGSTTITPGTSQKTAVSSGRYTTGNVYVAGDSDLVASNIKSGVNIFGVTGTFEGGGNAFSISTTYPPHMMTVKSEARPGEFVTATLTDMPGIRGIETDGGDNVPYTENIIGISGGTVTFVMPASNVTIS